jgi:hypothetical protein
MAIWALFHSKIKNEKMDLSHIQSKIHTIRDYKVMLDFDLAETYEIENKYLKRAVRNNIKRFEGEDFMFELTKEELLRCKFCTLNKKGRGQHFKYLPFAFTELGVAMLSSVLNSEKAIDTNRKIMRAFVAVRHLILNPPPSEEKELQNEVRQLKQDIEETFSDYNDINEETRAELDNINQSLSVANVQFSEIYQALIELADRKKELEKPRNKIGYIKT